MTSRSSYPQLRDGAQRETDSLGRRFARARVESGRSQEELAAALGWKTQASISGVENDVVRIHLRQLDRLARMLGKRVVLVDADDMTTEETTDA